eukprot:756078-Pelagomonas_calceolata.AAC.7
MDGQCHGTEVQEGTQEWTARYVHLVLVACAVAIFGVHLGAGLGLPLLASWFGRFEGWARYRVTPCLSRQTQKLMCLAALGLGSPLACQHLSWTSAVDLVLLIVQFVAQEVGATPAFSASVIARGVGASSMSGSAGKEGDDVVKTQQRAVKSEERGRAHP